MGLEVIATSGDDPTVGTAFIRKGDVAQLQERVDRYAHQVGHPGRSYLSAIEDIQPVPADTRVSSEIDLHSTEELDCLLLLYAGLSEREQSAIQLAIRGYLAERGRALAGAASLSSGVTSMATRLRPGEVRDLLAAFSTIRWIRPDRVFFLDEATPTSRIPPDVVIEAPLCSTAVAVVDSGIVDDCVLFNGLVEQTINRLPAGATPHRQHGTFVASRVLFGDDVERDIQSKRVTPHCHVVDVPIFSKGPSGGVAPVDEQVLAALVDEVLPLLPPSVRVVNLSMGTNAPIKDYEFSVLAQVLDARARELDLLVVTTAGNIRGANLISTYPQYLHYPEWRIDPPGEALLALTVGSIARHHDVSALATPRQLSPFSRVGPGADRGVKPELVAHGGNCLKSGHSTSRLGVEGLHGSGTACGWDIGTSFAAPLISAMAARLFNHYGSVRANLVKALLCHFSNPAVVPSCPHPPHFLVGFGEPSLDACMWSGEHSAAFLYSGEMTKTEYQYVPFFVPQALEPSGKGRLRIRGTVALDPPINPNSGQEYAKARVTIQLRKRLEVGFRDVALNSPTIGDARWAPILQFDEPFARGYSSGPWELRLRLFTRDLPDDYHQRYSVVVEVIDTTGSVDVWSEIEAEAGGQFRPFRAGAAA